MKKQLSLLLLAAAFTLPLSAQIPICKNAYVWDFVCEDCEDDMKKLTKGLTREFDNLLSQYDCSTVERVELANVVAQKENEEAFNSGKLSASQRKQLESVSAEVVVLGKVYTNGSFDAYWHLEVKFVELATTIKKPAIIHIPKTEMLDPNKRAEYFRQGILEVLGKKPEIAGTKPTTTEQAKVEPVQSSGTVSNAAAANATVNVGSGNVVWMHTSGKPSIWKIDSEGNFLKDKVHSPVLGWSLVNCYKNKVLWRHSTGKISLWTIDSDGNVLKYKEHGPLDGWVAVSFSNDKILWRHTTGKISLWSVDDNGAVLHYKEHGPFVGWTALAQFEGNMLWKNNSGAVSIWKIDNLGTQTTYKEQKPIPDWTLVNCYGNKVLWSHTSGKVSLWTIDDFGNVQKYKEHGPMGDWRAVCYSEGKILWRRPNGKVSLWTVDDDGNQTSYKEYGPVEGWNAIFFTNKLDR